MIVSGGDGAQAARRGNSLQSGDASTDYKNARGRNRSARRGEHGEHARQGVGAHEHGFVPADGAHGGERVHALRARGAGH
jgi:hypothetical protein